MILVLSDLWLPFPGGAERLAFNLARHLAQQDDVHVLTGYEAAQQFDGPPVETAPTEVDDRALGWKRIADVIDQVRPRVILTHHLYAHTFAADLARCGIPVVQVVLNGQRLPGAALAVYISEWVRAQAGDARPGDMVITPPAFAADVAAGSHGDAIGFVKPLPHKGVDLVYRLAEAMPDRQFLILRGEWQTLETIRHLPNVTFMEPVVDIRDFYRHVRLMLVPSTSEDAGTIAQEAALNGLPCLASNVGGLAETAAGGIPLRSNHLPSWIEAILSLDDPVAYQLVADRQREHLAAADHAGLLDHLADAIRALA